MGMILDGLRKIIKSPAPAKAPVPAKPSIPTGLDLLPAPKQPGPTTVAASDVAAKELSATASASREKALHTPAGPGSMSWNREWTGPGKGPGIEGASKPFVAGNGADAVETLELSKKILEDAGKGFDAITEADMKQGRLIPAGQDAYGNQRYRLAASDHRYADQWDKEQANRQVGASFERVGSAASWTPPSQILSEFTEHGGGDPLPLMPGETMAEHLKKDYEQYVLTAATVLKDANYQIANNRKDSADSPYTKADDPITVYELGNGVKFEVDPNKPDEDPRMMFFRMKNGYIISGDDMELAFKTGAVYALPDGRTFDAEAADPAKITAQRPKELSSWQRITDPKDPRMEFAGKAADGNYYYAKNLVLGDGQVVSQDDFRFNVKTTTVKLRDGRTLAVTDLPQSDAEVKEAFFQYRAPDGETVLMNADGTVPPGLRVYMEQKPQPENNLGDKIANFTRWNVANPRGPWQDEAGNNAWDIGKFDPAHSTVDEVAPWFYDTNMGSVPYYLPPAYSYPSAAAESIPYLYGVAGESYLPMSRNPKDVGRGTYSGDRISNSQAFGGTLAGPVDAWAEKFGKKIIGGLGEMPGPKQVKGVLGKMATPSMRAMGKKLAGSTLGKIGESALGEGYEELWSAPFSELQTTGAKMYGYPKYMNSQTNEWEYDTSKPGGFFSPTALSSYSHQALTGAALGGATRGGLMGYERFFGEGRTGRTPKLPPIPDAMPTAPTLPNVTPGQSSLDRRYEKVEW